MTHARRSSLVMASVVGILGLSGAAFADPKTMTFFLTSAGPGNGANLGGLDLSVRQPRLELDTVIVECCD